ncbi:hypothetical protein AgCh_013315 [Apium graveolens]
MSSPSTVDSPKFIINGDKITGNTLIEEATKQEPNRINTETQQLGHDNTGRACKRAQRRNKPATMSPEKDRATANTGKSWQQLVDYDSDSSDESNKDVDLRTLIAPHMISLRMAKVGSSPSYKIEKKLGKGGFGQVHIVLVCVGVPSLKRGKLEAACEDFSNVIDTSSRGTVYKGTLSTGAEIAVMSLTVESVKEWPENLEAQFRKKMGDVLRNRSFEMVEALYTMNRSHASSGCKWNVVAYSPGFSRTKKHCHFHAIMKIFKDARIE